MKKENCSYCQDANKAIDKLKLNNKNSKTVNKKPGKIAILFLVLIILGAVGIYKFWQEGNSAQVQSAQDIPKQGPQIGLPAPDFTAGDISGRQITLSNFRNQKPVLLIFWATWCGYCAKELEDLKTFTQKYQDKIQIIAVDSGEPKSTIKDYIQEKNVNFLMLLDEQKKIWNQYLVRGTPSHFLIDKEGKIVTLRPGLSLLKDLETMLSMLN